MKNLALAVLILAAVYFCTLAWMRSAKIYMTCAEAESLLWAARQGYPPTPKAVERAQQRAYSACVDDPARTR